MGDSILLPFDSSHLKVRQEDCLAMVLAHTIGVVKALPQPISDSFTTPHSISFPLLLFSIIQLVYFIGCPATCQDPEPMRGKGR